MCDVMGGKIEFFNVSTGKRMKSFAIVKASAMNT